MKDKTLQIFLHIIGCLIFLTLPIFLAPDFPESLNISESIPTEKNLIAYFLLIGFFYANFFVFIPKFYFGKKYFVFVLVLIVCFAVISLLPSIIIPDRNPAHLSNKVPPKFSDSHPPPPPTGETSLQFSNARPESSQPQNYTGALIQHLFIFLAVVFLSLILRISNRLRLTEKEKLNAELLYLKAQINPHFLFNTLNNIYSLALEKSDKTPLVVVKLSGMMRYVLSDADKDFVPLEKEISYINNYVELQQVRFEDTIKLSFKVNGETNSKKIAPLILIPFIENAFKHGINAEEESDIKIQIDINDSLHLQVTNNKVNTYQSEEARSGVGITNTKNRLQLLYPSKHILAITDNENIFFVSLILHL
jgi:hypothetical protein